MVSIGIPIFCKNLFGWKLKVHGPSACSQRAGLLFVGLPVSRCGCDFSAETIWNHKKKAAEWPNEHKASLSEVEKTDSKDFPHVLAPKDKLDLAILDFGTGSSS